MYPNNRQPYPDGALSAPQLCGIVSHNQRTMTFQHRIALITGGSRGLGKNAALHLAAQGCDLIITYHTRRDDAEAVVAEAEALGRRAVALPLDVSDTHAFPAFAEAVRQALDAVWGRADFDFLVNNAGIDAHMPVGAIDEARFDALVNVHFKGVVFLTQTLLPLLADGGRIVNVSTGLARFTIPGYGVYAALKAAVETFSRYLAKELGQRRINVNTVAPGAIETDFTAPAFAHNPGIKDFIASQTALGRVGQPDDIGPLVAFLCSDAARWVNAQRVEASGGMFL